jgi:glycosyltransferase involved in cell wall biosynthesis
MIAVLSDSPTLTTGFGRTTRIIAQGLHDAGHQVSCFGIKARPADIGQTPYRVWPAERGGHWTDTLPEFFQATDPRCLVVNMDAYNAVEVITATRNSGYHGPVISYVVFDGLPVGEHYLKAQRSCDGVLASSQTAATYMHANGINVIGVAPPGVDMDVFRPVTDRQALRDRAGVSGVCVVGVFGVNSERKQTARVLAALPRIAADLSPASVVLYLHCRQVGYWRLEEMARDLGVADQVLFPAASGFDEWRGVPDAAALAAPISSATTATPTGQVPPELSYVERLNLCDVIINVPHSGDIEQVILEAQACGVPLIHTNDGAVMAEAVGAGGLLLSARDVGIGRAGEQIQHIASTDIAAAAVRLLTDDAQAASLRQAGFANVTRYPWTTLSGEVCKAVADVLGQGEAVDR